MHKPFTREEWAKMLEPLSKYHRAAFAAACAERLFEHYLMFCRENHWGNPVLARKALNHVWEWVLTQSFSERDVKSLIEKLMEVTPDGDDFGDDLGTYGQNAMICLLYSLDCFIEKEVMPAVYAAEKAIESIYFYIEDLFLEQNNMLELVSRKGINALVYQKELHEMVDTHPVMINELRKQKEDIELLKAHPVLTLDVVETLRKTALENRIVIEKCQLPE